MPCFGKIPVSKKVMDKREGEVSLNSAKTICLTVSEKLVEERFCAVFQKNSDSESVYG